MPDPTTLRALRLAGGICGLEATTVAAMGVVEIVSLDTGRLALGVTTAVFLFVYAAGLALAGLGLARARSWARAPVVLSQLIQLGIAWSFYGGSTTWVALLLAVPAAVVVVISVRPSTTSALYGDAPRDDAAAG